jgi:acyl-CoA synthetase (AMP-forming)/AMP-acid ligase II
MDEPVTLLQAWQRTVARDRDGRALIDGSTSRTWSRGELAAAGEAWAARWAATTALPGRRVLFAEPNGPRWFAVFLGLLHAGAVPVPADATEPAENLRRTAEAIGAAALWQGEQLQCLAPRPRSRTRDLCLVKLTSGSTGLPRARAFTHAQMLADGRQVCSSMGIQETDLNLAVIPLGHSYGLGNLVVPLLAQGTPLVCSAAPLPQALAADCARWRPTVFPAVPTLLRALVRAEVEPAALASLRLVISAGAVLPPEVATAFAARFGRRVHSFYGSSETGGITYDRTGEAALTGRSVGTPMDGVRLHFRAAGRFTVESAAVIGRGRFSPPDRAELTAEGELRLIGRVGRTVKIAGRRLDPAEVERALLAIAGVRGACAFAHPARPDALAAVVAADVSPALLRSALATTMAAWKIPERLVVVPELPVTARGKPDRTALRTLIRGA